jgi:predicted PurR-regulated permease PerM
MIERRRRDVVTPLLAALSVILVLAFQVFGPFLLDFAVAASVALLLVPAQRRLSRAMGERHSAAAALLVLLTTVVILLPVVSSLYLLARQALVFFEWLGSHLQPGELELFWEETLSRRFPGLREWVARDNLPFAPLVSSVLGQLAGMANVLLQGTLTGFTRAVFDLFLFLVMLYFLLRDGRTLRNELRPISPFSHAQEDQIFEHLGKTAKGALQSMVVVPVVQGIAAGIGFFLFGVPSPFVWGSAVILAAMVPVLGSPLGWVPACVYLYLTAETWQAVGMLLYGTLVVSGIDNVIKPMLLREAAQIHPLLGFLSILGGILAYGAFGFLVGPVILSLVLSAIRIYRMDVLRPGALPTPDPPPPALPSEAVSASPA